MGHERFLKATSLVKLSYSHFVIVKKILTPLKFKSFFQWRRKMVLSGGGGGGGVGQRCTKPREV